MSEPNETTQTLSSLDRWHTEPFQTPALKPGMVVAMAMDAGPGGPCGQSMSTTCPWQHIHIFPDEATFRSWTAEHSIGRKGSRYLEAFAVLGDYGTGHMRITNHCPQTIEAEAPE